MPLHYAFWFDYRLELKDEIHQPKVVNLEQYSFAKDIVVYNLKEQNQETVLVLRNKVYDMLLDDMKIPKPYIFHPQNPAGEIRIDNCFRIGKSKPNTTRPVIVSLLTQIGKQVIMDRNYIKNLTSSSKVRLTHRYQSEMRERREAQLDTFKLLRDQKKDTNETVHLVNDKILVKGIQS